MVVGVCRRGGVVVGAGDMQGKRDVLEGELVMSEGFGAWRFVFVELRSLVMVEVVVVVVVVLVLVVLMSMVGIDDTTTVFTSRVDSVHVVVHNGRARLQIKRRASG